MPVLLTSGTVSAAATLDIVLTSYTAYRALTFLLTGWRPATDDVMFWMRMSTDGGSTYEAGATTYEQDKDDDGAMETDTKIYIIYDVGVAGIGQGNASTEFGNFEIYLPNQTSTAFWPEVEIYGSYRSAEAGIIHRKTMPRGTRRAAQDVDAVRFLYESGNITEGKYAVYGWL